MVDREQNIEVAWNGSKGRISKCREFDWLHFGGSFEFLLCIKLFSTIWVPHVFLAALKLQHALIGSDGKFDWFLHTEVYPVQFLSLFSCPTSFEMYLFSLLKLNCCQILKLPNSEDGPSETAVNDFSISAHFPLQHVATAVKQSTFGLLPWYS